MASVLIYNTGNGRALSYLPSVNTPEYEGRPDVIINPTMPAGVLVKYLKVIAGVVSEMTAGEKTTVDTADASAADAALRTDSKTNLAALNEENLKLRAVLIYVIQQIKVAVPAYVMPTKAAAITAIRTIIDNNSAD